MATKLEKDVYELEHYLSLGFEITLGYEEKTQRPFRIDTSYFCDEGEDVEEITGRGITFRGAVTEFLKAAKKHNLGARM